MQAAVAVAVTLLASAAPAAAVCDKDPVIQNIDGAASACEDTADDASCAFQVNESGDVVLHCHRRSYIGIPYIKQGGLRRNDSPALVCFQCKAGFVPSGPAGCAAGAWPPHEGGPAAPTVRAFPGWLRALSVSHSKSILYGDFVWTRRALNSPKRQFSAPAVRGPADLRDLRLRGGALPPPIFHPRLYSSVGQIQSPRGFHAGAESGAEEKTARRTWPRPTTCPSRPRRAGPAVLHRAPPRSVARWRPAGDRSAVTQSCRSEGPLENIFSNQLRC
jgi:hypothetical protein